MLSSTPELPFFEGDKPSRYTQEAIQFCREFDMLGRRTQEFVKLMDQHGLFELTPLALPRAKPDGTPDEPTKIGEYLRISEQKLNALPKDTYLELRDKGVSAVMHAHLLSLALWPKILSRAARIQASTPLQLSSAPKQTESAAPKGRRFCLGRLWTVGLQARILVRAPKRGPEGPRSFTALALLALVALTFRYEGTEP